MTLTTVTLGTYKATVDASIAPKLLRADNAMFAATGKHIQIVFSYRSPEKQAELYKNRKPGQRVAPPGKSFHEKGLALDVSNWQAAEPFLKKEGFLNPMENDKGHFSIGEFGAAKYLQPAAAAGSSALLIIAVGILLWYIMYKR